MASYSCNLTVLSSLVLPKSAKSRRGMTFAAMRDHQHHGSHNNKDFGGRVVDENMIILRKRIHEMKMMEEANEPPMEWMEWEKKMYTSYDSTICDAVGLLQSVLMDTRPALVLGTIALLAISVPLSSVVVASNFVELARAILDRIHPI